MSLATVGLASALAACSDRAAEHARREAVVERARLAQLGCTEIRGSDWLTVEGAPRFVLVGEPQETAEGPAAFAEIACRMAASLGPGDGPLFVGVMDYPGGRTVAETARDERLRQMQRAGARIDVKVVNSVRRFDPHNRSSEEALWAEDVVQRSAGAGRVLLLVPRADAQLAPLEERERFAGFEPLAMHLPQGQVLSLEIRAESAGNAGVRRYPSPIDGFHGALMLDRLTRSPIGGEGAAEAPAVPSAIAAREELRLRREAQSIVDAAGRTLDQPATLGDPKKAMPAATKRSFEEVVESLPRIEIDQP